LIFVFRIHTLLVADIFALYTPNPHDDSHEMDGAAS
jgi:hypothetical protein